MKKPAKSTTPRKPANVKPNPPPAPLADPTEDDISDDAITALVTGGANGAFIPAADVRPLKHFGYCTADMTKSDTDGNVAAWITEAGQTYFDENYDLTNEEGTEATTAGDGGFIIRTDVPLPTGKRGYSDRGGKYPFETMPVNGSFHIPATAEKPKPSATFASTVTSANRRFAEKAGEGQTPRKFVCRAVGPADPDGVGARIYRIA